jgi:hypothetical protein
MAISGWKLGRRFKAFTKKTPHSKMGPKDDNHEHRKADDDNGNHR